MKSFIISSVITGIGIFSFFWIHFVFVLATYYTQALEIETMLQKASIPENKEENEPLVNSDEIEVDSEENKNSVASKI